MELEKFAGALEGKSDGIYVRTSEGTSDEAEIGMAVLVAIVSSPGGHIGNNAIVSSGSEGLIVLFLLFA